MKTSSMAWLAVIVVLILVAAWYFLSAGSAAAPAPATAPAADTQSGPSVQAGINGSVNQGNLGQPDTSSTGSGQAGTPQQPPTQH